ncbi:hypothetical protein SAMN05421863_101286 [Nitrosomonas communis]|uniref:Uncharacterized protein n=1 Tax=Nitrosomonas communis TaxID=44574 RepID=A0A1I4N0M7_9PROT|nr:hypothetical protein SAMN05421863_101286 [Nitrosomonas communis]
MRLLECALNYFATIKKTIFSMAADNVRSRSAGRCSRAQTSLGRALKARAEGIAAKILSSLNISRIAILDS